MFGEADIVVANRAGALVVIEVKAGALEEGGRKGGGALAKR